MAYYLEEWKKFIGEKGKIAKYHIEGLYLKVFAVYFFSHNGYMSVYVLSFAMFDYFDWVKSRDSECHWTPFGS